MAVIKCPKCGTSFDPSFTKGRCPTCGYSPTAAELGIKEIKGTTRYGIHLLCGKI